MFTCFTWLIFKDGNMFCSLCQAYKMNHSLTEGSDNYHTLTLMRHAEVKDHRLAISVDLDANNMERLIHRIFSVQDQALIFAIRTVYFLAKEDIASVTYPDFIDFW